MRSRALLPLRKEGEAQSSGCGPANCGVTVKVKSSFTGRHVTDRKVTASLFAVMFYDTMGTGEIGCTNFSPTWALAYSQGRRDQALAARAIQPPRHMITAEASVFACRGAPDVRAIKQILCDKLAEIAKRNRTGR